MRERRQISYLVGILSLLLAVTALCGCSSSDGTAFADNNGNVHWTQSYIGEVPPIMMYEPYFSLFGQTDGTAPYKYEDSVLLAGHSCGAVAGAWEITRKALEVLYDADETPVRGEIKVYIPGAKDEWNLGVFGEVITYITGAATNTGFKGAEFKAVDSVYNRQNLMIYEDETSGTNPWEMEWIFERMDTLEKVVVKKVYVIYDVRMIQPPKNDPRNQGVLVASGEATEEQVADYIEWWNERAEFVFDNADTLSDFITVTEVPVP